MEIRDTMPFADELLSPTYEESFRREGVTAGEGEVMLDGRWAIAVYVTEQLVQVAADHLRGFLEKSMGCDMSTCGTEKRLILDVDAGMDDNPESHLLRVDESGIQVIGAGPQGVLQGVFRLEMRMREKGAPVLASGEEKRVPLFKHRIHRSPLSCFYKEELTGFAGHPFAATGFARDLEYPAYREQDAGPDVFYDDNMLMRLLEHGFNGIWIRGAFRHFARTSVFPEWGELSDEILARLRKVTDRAERFGMKVFLYLNEPLGVAEDDEFFDKYPQCKGAPSSRKPWINLCTSTPEVKSYLKESAEYIFTHVPKLAGFMMITASEFPSHCWCRSGISPDDPNIRIREVEACPRCMQRTPQDTVGELVGLIHKGATAAKPDAEIIAWNWSWGMWEPDPQRGVLEALPPEVIVMGDYERGEPTEALGFQYTNDEYSIKVVGPSARFRGVADFLQSQGRPVYAKLQIGTTHENPNIPYLPVPPKIAQKYVGLPKAGVSGMMTCWNFGNMPSLGTEIAGEFSWSPQLDVQTGLRAIAVRHFGEAAADDVLAAWEIMSRAHDAFPSSIPVMYYGPISRGPCFPFMFDPIDKAFPKSWLLEGDIRGDRLDWTAPFGPEKVLECYRAEAARGWTAVELLKRAWAKAGGQDRLRLERETGVMEFHLIQTESAANVVDFLLNRNAFHDSDNAGHKGALLDRIEQICRAEMENAARALPLLDADARLGWHGEAYGYMITRAGIEEKLASLQELLDKRLPDERAKL
jgi:hypothetical protein